MYTLHYSALILLQYYYPGDGWNAWYKYLNSKNTSRIVINLYLSLFFLRLAFKLLWKLISDRHHKTKGSFHWCDLYQDKKLKTWHFFCPDAHREKIFIFVESYLISLSWTTSAKAGGTKAVLSASSQTTWDPKSSLFTIVKFFVFVQKLF